MSAATAAASSAAGTQRAGVPEDFWKVDAPPMQLGRDHWQVWAQDPGASAGDEANLTQLVTSLNWDDSDAKTTGEVTLMRPDLDVSPFPVKPNSRIRLRVDRTGTGAWEDVWVMICKNPSETAFDGSITLEMEVDVGRLETSQDDFYYHKDKKHPNGWTYDQIIRDVCQRYSIPVGKIEPGTHRIKKLKLQNHAPKDVITTVLKREHIATGKRLFIRYESGVLNILPATRSRWLMEMGGLILDATVGQNVRDDFASVVEVRSSKRVGKKKREKVVALVTNPEAVKQFGYVKRIIRRGGLETVGEAKSFGTRWLNRRAQPIRDVTLKHVGYPFLRRGDALRINLPAQGVKQICFVGAVSHALTPSSYEMEIQVLLEDPFVDKAKSKTKQKKHKNTAKKGRTTTDGQASDKPKGKYTKQHGT